MSSGLTEVCEEVGDLEKGFVFWSCSVNASSEAEGDCVNGPSGALVAGDFVDGPAGSD